jgi:hypothetical protein
LWIDAICINQKDTAERNEQVKQMGKIYKFAERVIVWLGPEFPSSKLTMSTLEFLGRQVELTKDYNRFRSPSCDEPDWNNSMHPLPYSVETLEAIFDLLGRSFQQTLDITGNPTWKPVFGHAVRTRRCWVETFSSSNFKSQRPERWAFPRAANGIGAYQFHVLGKEC